METDLSQTVRGMAEELGVCSDAVFDGVKRIGKVKKLKKWVLHDLNDRQELSPSRFVLLCPCATKTILRWIGSSRVMKNEQETFRTVVGDR